MNTFEMNHSYLIFYKFDSFHFERFRNYIDYSNQNKIYQLHFLFFLNLHFKLQNLNNNNTFYILLKVRKERQIKENYASIINRVIEMRIFIRFMMDFPYLMNVNDPDFLMLWKGIKLR